MKKIFSLLLCVMMLTAVAACGGTGSTGTSAATASTTLGNTAGTTQSTNNTAGTTNGTTSATTNATTATTTVVTPNENFDADNIVLSFGAVSDIHITGDTTTANKFRAALAQLKAQAAIDDANGLDAVAIAGDIADSGAASQVKIFSDIVKESGIDNVMLTTGNHDFYGESNASLSDYFNAMGESYFAADVDKSMFDKGARHCVVGDYHFIFVEPVKYSNNCPYDEDVLKWLDNTLKEITTQNPNAYVFFFTHPMIYKTCYGSELSGGSWYTTYLTDTLSKYPQVMTFGGHLHFPVNDERSIMQTSFTSVGCGSVRYLAIERGYSNMASATVPKDAHSVSSGLLVQVDASGNVRITRMDFSNESTFKEAWELSYPKEDGSHLDKYSIDRAEDNSAPVLTGEAVINVTFSPTGTISSSITIPAGSDDDFVHHYNITVKNETTGAVSTYKFLSDFYRHPQTSDMAKTLTFPLDLTEEGVYRAEIVAVDSWDAESEKIVCEKAIGENVEPLPSELPEVYADFEFAGGTITDKNGKFTIELRGGATVVNTPLTFAGYAKETGAMIVAKAGDYALVKFKDYTAATITDFYNSATGFSVEALFVNKAPSGSQGIVCGTQSGGWGIAQSEGSPYLFTYVGSGNININANKKSSTTELTHVVATVIYNSIDNTTYTTLYINGEPLSSGSKEGKVAISSASAAATAFCLGADIDKNGNGSDFKMTDFAIADVKIYANALNYKQVETAYSNAVEAFKN